MTTCTSCGSDVTGKKFCQNCGTPVQATHTPAASGQTVPPPSSFCTHCGRQAAPSEHFCSGCGSPLGTSVGAPMTQSSAMPSGQYTGQPQPYPTQYGQPDYS